MGNRFAMFAVQLSSSGDRAILERRAERLVSFYRPLGLERLSLRWIPELRLLLGAVEPAGGARLDADVVVWGGPAPAGLRGARKVLDAGDRELRSLDSIAAVAAVSPARARLVTGSGGITALYAARSSCVAAWSTHGVAAAWLTRGAVRLDSGALPEFLAFEYAGGDRTLLEGVRAVPVATCIDLTPSGASERSYWPRAERWARVPEEEAPAQVEEHLLESLGRRLGDATTPLLGLTAGFDSRVVAVALRELGISFEALTWGRPDSSDVRGGREVAAALGVAHRWHRVERQDARGHLARLDRLARWSDGTCPLDLAGDVWPNGGSAFVTGQGSGVGRNYYYLFMPRVLDEPEPTLRRLERLLAVPVRIARANPEVIRHVQSRAHGWLVEAEELGYRGWRCLDVVYGEQRLRRWGRLLLQPSTAPAVAAFATPEQSRALASLPLADHISHGFHRRFLARRFPRLAPAAPSLRRSPAPVRVTRRAVAPIARPATDLARRARPPGRGEWPDARLWPSAQEVREWLMEEVLGADLLVGALGERWARHTRERFLRNERKATEKTLLAASPVALSRALSDLSSDGTA